MYVRAATLTRHPLVSARALLAAGLIAGLLAITMAPHARAATTLNVGVGVGSGTTAGNVYAPGDVTVLVGDSVKFTIESDEPHSVTFGNGPADVAPPEWPAAGFTGTNPPPPGLASLTGTYAGTGFLNTSLMFGKGSNATVTFTAAGAFAFLCQIHPGMAGTVNVVASGTTTTQAEADAKATLTRNAILGAEAALEAAQTAQVTETKRSDGTSLWNIFTNSGQAPAPQPGGGTGYLELMRFVPPSLDIQEGDTVKWTALALHSVTFPGATQDPSTIDPFTTPPDHGRRLRRLELLPLGLARGRTGRSHHVRADVPGRGHVQLHLCAARLPGPERRDQRRCGAQRDDAAHRPRAAWHGSADVGRSVAGDRIAGRTWRCDCDRREGCPAAVAPVPPRIRTAGWASAHPAAP